MEADPVSEAVATLLDGHESRRDHHRWVDRETGSMVQVDTIIASKEAWAGSQHSSSPLWSVVSLGACHVLAVRRPLL